MKKILVLGGTVFVSRFVSRYFVRQGEKVYVLNRNHHVQEEGVHLIKADRHHVGDILKKHHFDVLLDITAYTKQNIVG